jgi:hypothetical protein
MDYTVEGLMMPYSVTLLNDALFSTTASSKHHTVPDAKMNSEKLPGNNVEGGGCSLI